MKKYLLALALAACSTAMAEQVKSKVEVSSCTKPVWPKEALRHEYQGTVTLAFLIGTDGEVLESRVDKSSKHQLLDTAALEAMARCKFKPATQDGSPVKSWIKMQYVWRLEEPPKATPEQLKKVQAGAERGEAEAQFQLAMIYLNGSGLPRDEAEGRKWMLKAAEQGSAAAQEMAGLLAAPRPNNPGDLALAISWLGKAAEQGRARSQFYLGAMLLAPSQSQRPEEGVKWLAKAAAQQDHDAQVMLAKCYEKGLGVPKDESKAQQLLEESKKPR